MSDHGLVVPDDAGDVTQFDPNQTYAKLAQIEAVIAYARKLKDWETLEDAANEQIAEQARFVADWHTRLTPNLSPGRGGVKSNSGRGSISVKEHVEATGITQQQVSRWRPKLGMQARTGPDKEEVWPLVPDPEKVEEYRNKIIGKGRQIAGLDPEDNHRAEGTGQDEWHTPGQYITAARMVMGDIDLDPASHPIAQQMIEATTCYTAADDGLTKDWHGRVWLNPPYSQPLIDSFAHKMVAEYSAGRVTQAIMLTHNYTDTKWWHHIAPAASLLCFTRGRIKFIDLNGDECSPTQGQCFCYFGPHADTFAAVFQKFGFIAEGFSGA